MKISDIEVGKVYTDGKGKLRKVFALVEMGRYRGDSVDVLYTHEHEGAWKGRTGRTWLPYFAWWAKAEVGEG